MNYVRVPIYLCIVTYILIRTNVRIYILLYAHTAYTHYMYYTRNYTHSIEFMAASCNVQYTFFSDEFLTYFFITLRLYLDETIMLGMNRQQRHSEMWSLHLI